MLADPLSLQHSSQIPDFLPEVQYLLLSVHEFQFSRNLVVHVVFPFCDKYKKALRRNQDEGL